jgi:hypothetical protein
MVKCAFAMIGQTMPAPEYDHAKAMASLANLIERLTKPALEAAAPFRKTGV